jgi:hypothetical protein
VLYLNKSQSFDGSYNSLSKSTTNTVQQIISQNIPSGATSEYVNGFASSITNLNNFIISGTWDMNLFADCSNNNVSLFYIVYGRTGSVETPIGNSS